MPAGKRRQSNAMLYTLITFVALFIIATTAAVIYYVKAEDFRTTRDALQDEMDKMVTRDESRNLSAIVGTKLPGQSNLGTVIEHFNQVLVLVKGTPIRATSAEVKVSEVRRAVQPLLDKARAYIRLPGAAPAAVDPNAKTAKKTDPNAADPNAAAPTQVALTTVLSGLLAKLEQVTQEKAAKEQELATRVAKFDDAVKIMEETKQKLAQDVQICLDQVNQTKADYAKLSASNDQSTKEQLGTLRGDLEKARADVKQLNDNLLKMQAEFNVATGRLQGALAQVNEIKPAPDKEVLAFKADGEIFLVDQGAGTVQINLGSDDHIYQGLTFSVYDRAAGIPRDGKPKAQIEVFAIDRKVSTARVLSWDRRNPIATGDHIANLIWDPDRQNQFIVVGDFDVDGDGKIDYDGVTRIEALIQRWGGVIVPDVTASTDYVILGTEPKAPMEPTSEVLAADPTAKEKYDAAKKRNEQYDQIRRRAEALWVPIFSYDRFLYFTGYANQIGKPGAL